MADSSQARQSGPLGVGTSLGEYAVLRRPDHTPSDPSDDSFVLLWDGQLSSLVYADPATGGDGLYHRGREQAGQALRISRHSGAPHGIEGGSYWLITDTQQLVWRLGATADSAWRAVDDTGARRPWRWNLDRVQDGWATTRSGATRPSRAA